MQAVINQCNLNILLSNILYILENNYFESDHSNIISVLNLNLKNISSVFYTKDNFKSCQVKLQCFYRKMVL